MKSTRMHNQHNRMQSQIKPPTITHRLVMLLIGLLLPFVGAQPFAADDPIYTINSIKALHTVSEKFVSISVDPAVLLTGLNLSETSLRLAKHLSPAYVRIAGPSTRFVKYQDENSGERFSESGIAVSPSMWFGINEWLAAANLTPVFGINNEEGEWNPQATRPLLEMSHKFNVNCYWQLGYDCGNKSEAQYGSDLRRLKHVLEAFPDMENTWKIVGSDPSRCLPELSVRKVLDDLEDVLTAVVLEPHSRVVPIKQKVPLWITLPKSFHAASFETAVSWAKELGEAAKTGYEVVLRQPRLHEMFEATPPFWVSVLHKNLMGRHVLDVRSTTMKPYVSVYAHCARHQNDFIRSGAMTVLMVNNGTFNHTVLLKFGTVSLRNIEVQSYILTAASEDATEVFLNGEKLTLNSFQGDKLKILPKLRRARMMNYLSLSLPAKSVGFFVLPAVKVPICINQETDLDFLIEEINNDQKLPFKEEEEQSVELSTRFAHHKTPTLRDLKQLMEKELHSDERYYKQMKTQKKKHVDDLEARNFFIERAAKKSFLKHQKEEEPKRVFELELTSAEIKKVLADRAKVKAAKRNIIFTSEELDEIMNKASAKFLNDKNTVIRIRKKIKREAPRNKKDINMRLLKLKSYGEKRRTLLQSLRQKKKHRAEEKKRERRDINMDLLKLKTGVVPKKGKSENEVALGLNKFSSDFSMNSASFDCFHEFSEEGKVNKKTIHQLWQAEMGKTKSNADSLGSLGDDYGDLGSDEQRLGTKRKIRDDSFNKRYKSLTENLKVWKPSDILGLAKSKKSKRSSDNCVDSVENEIDNFMSEVAKDPNLMEKGDLELVFPNKDKLEVVKNNGETEVEVVFHGETCPTTEENSTVSPNIQKISKDNTEGVWERLFCKVSHFFQGLSSKLKKYIMGEILK